MYNNETSYIITDSYEHYHAYQPEHNYNEMCGQVHLPQFTGYVMHNIFGQPVYHPVAHHAAPVQEIPSTPLDLQLVLDEEQVEHMEVAIPRSHQFAEIKEEHRSFENYKQESNPFDYIKKEDKNSSAPTRSLPKQATMILKVRVSVTHVLLWG
jgi:hypothetical protein